MTLFCDIETEYFKFRITLDPSDMVIDSRSTDNYEAIKSIFDEAKIFMIYRLRQLEASDEFKGSLPKRRDLA